MSITAHQLLVDPLTNPYSNYLLLESKLSINGNRLGIVNTLSNVHCTVLLWKWLSNSASN